MQSHEGREQAPSESKVITITEHSIPGKTANFEWEVCKFWSSIIWNGSFEHTNLLELYAADTY